MLFRPTRFRLMRLCRRFAWHTFASRSLILLYLLLLDTGSQELDMMYGVADALETHLTNEAENGRLLKLLIKLGTINERPEQGRCSS